MCAPSPSTVREVNVADVPNVRVLTFPRPCTSRGLTISWNSALVFAPLSSLSTMSLYKDSEIRSSEWNHANKVLVNSRTLTSSPSSWSHVVMGNISVEPAPRSAWRNCEPPAQNLGYARDPNAHTANCFPFSADFPVSVAQNSMNCSLPVGTWPDPVVLANIVMNSTP
jgi:hypothetical protein